MKKTITVGKIQNTKIPKKKTESQDNSKTEYTLRENSGLIVVRKFDSQD